MEFYAARLASFSTAYIAGKKCASSAKKTKGASAWPHELPAPEQLAQAGFYFQPLASSPDQLTCFACSNNFDGWEASDDPVQEHLALSPACPWAIQMGVEQEINKGQELSDNPTSEKMILARKATFSDAWPHEKKRGWTCKTQKMVDAGWYFCPSAESEDFVRCAYCGLSLDGWEPKDKPRDEHERRSPDCPFFTVEPLPKTKTRSKKARASKVSRVSIDTNTSLAQDERAEPFSAIEIGESVIISGSSSNPALDKPKNSSRPKRGKKGTTKAVDAAEENFSSFVEPEDDDFKVKVASPPIRSTRGRKRQSNETMASLNETSVSPVTTKASKRKSDEATLDSPEALNHPPKRRTTRTRSSTIQPQSRPSDMSIIDVHMSDADDASVLPAAVPRTRGKNARKRGSSTRKVSTISTASKASMRAKVPADEEIDAALEEDLDRPRPEDEAEPEIRVQKQTERKISRSTAKQGKRIASRRVASRTKKNQTVAEEAGQPQVVPDSALQYMETMETGASQESREGLSKSHLGTDKKDSDVSKLEPIETEATEVVDNPLIDFMEIDHIEPKEVLKIAEEIRDEQIFAEVKDQAGNEYGKKKTNRGKKTQKTATSKRLTSSEIFDTVEEAAEHNQAFEQYEGLNPSAISQKATEDTISTTDTAIAPTGGLFEKSSTPKAVRHAAKEQMQCPSPTPSPQSSNAENHPPSSRPSQVRPPLEQITSPLQTHIVRLAPAERTPTGSPSRRALGKLQSTRPWTAADIEYILMGTPRSNKENEGVHDAGAGIIGLGEVIGSPEKRMTVEEWIKFNAKKGEERLRTECERIVGKFETEGIRAMKTLDGVACID